MTRSILATFVLLVGGLPSASAQSSTLYLRIGASSFECSEDCATLYALDPDTLTIERRGRGSATIQTFQSPHGLQSDDLYVTPDGAYVVWLEPDSPNGSLLVLHDTQRRSLSTVPLGPASTGNRLLGNPRRAEVFIGDATGPLSLSLAGPRRFGSGQCPGGQPLAISDDASRVAYSCSGGVAVFDVGSGATINTLPSVTSVALDIDGSHLYGIRAQSASITPALIRYDVATGSALNEVVLSGSIGPHVMVRDPRSGQLVVLTSSQNFTTARK